MPLIIGDFFVLTYYAADVIIVGRYRYIEANALEAVSPIMNIMFFLLLVFLNLK